MGGREANEVAIAEAPERAIETTGRGGAAGASVNGKAPAGAAASGGAKPGEGKKPKTLAGVYVQTPPELRGKLEEVAAKAGVTPQVWVRDHLAGLWGVTLPPVTKRVKYASEEEKKVALKERNKAKNELIKKLLADYQAKQAASGAAA